MTIPHYSNGKVSRSPLDLFLDSTVVVPMDLVNLGYKNATQTEAGNIWYREKPPYYVLIADDGKCITSDLLRDLEEVIVSSTTC